MHQRKKLASKICEKSFGQLFDLPYLGGCGQNIRCSKLQAICPYLVVFLCACVCVFAQGLWVIESVQKKRAGLRLTRRYLVTSMET